METLLTFPPGKHRQVVRQVRRDPRFAPQLYFLTIEEERGRAFLSFEQAIWDTEKNQVTSRVFLKHSVMDRPTDVPTSHTLQCAVDEKGRWIYVVSIKDRELIIERLVLKYEKQDKFGYRHIPYHAACFELKSLFFEKDITKTFSLTAINVCPLTDQIVLYHKFLDKSSQPPQVSFTPHRNDIGKVADSKRTLLNELQSDEMEARSHIFSRGNDSLILVSYHTRNPPADAQDQKDRNKIRVGSPDGFMILYSYDAKLEPINTLQIDPVQLLESFLPKTQLQGLKTSCAPALMPDFMFLGAHLQLLGEVHKYVLFFFHNKHVLAAKWPKNWYKLQQVPEVQLKRVICVDNKQKRRGQICDVWLLSTNLYLKVEKSGVQAVRKMDLGHKFKDYRRCAFCGKEEKGKNKNKHGKRMSSFKVCRFCKELNLHKSYMVDDSMGCHYCSFECVRKDWKQHKRAHSSKENQE